MRYMISKFLFFTTLSFASIIDSLPNSDTKLKLNSTLQLFTFSGEYGVTGYIKKVQYDASQKKGKSAIPDHIETAYILEIEWKVKILDDIDTADSAPLVEEVQLTIPEYLLEYSESAAGKYRKVHVEGRFFKGDKDQHVREIIMDVKRISIVK